MGWWIFMKIIRYKELPNNDNLNVIFLALLKQILPTEPMIQSGVCLGNVKSGKLREPAII